MPEILLRLDHRERMAESFVLDDSRVVDTLVLTEDAVGKRNSFPPHLQRPINEIVKFDILAAQVLRNSLRSRMICLRS